MGFITCYARLRQKLPVLATVGKVNQILNKSLNRFRNSHITSSIDPVKALNFWPQKHGGPLNQEANLARLEGLHFNRLGNDLSYDFHVSIMPMVMYEHTVPEVVRHSFINVLENWTKQSVPLNLKLENAIILANGRFDKLFLGVEVADGSLVSLNSTLQKLRNKLDDKGVIVGIEENTEETLDLSNKFLYHASIGWCDVKNRDLGPEEVVWLNEQIKIRATGSIETNEIILVIDNQKFRFLI